VNSDSRICVEHATDSSAKSAICFASSGFLAGLTTAMVFIFGITAAGASA